MQLNSPSFEDGDGIPTRYTCDGKDISPPLEISGVPGEAKSLALICEDPDAPSGTFTHWMVWNLDPHVREFPEGRAPSGAKQLVNDFGSEGYGGPCPPSGTHRYYFRLYALDAAGLPAPASGKAFGRAITGHILDEATLMGLYSRSRNRT